MLDILCSARVDGKITISFSNFFCSYWIGPIPVIWCPLFSTVYFVLITEVPFFPRFTYTTNARSRGTSESTLLALFGLATSASGSVTSLFFAAILILLCVAFYCFLTFFPHRDFFSCFIVLLLFLVSFPHRDFQ